MEENEGETNASSQLHVFMRTYIRTWSGLRQKRDSFALFHDNATYKAPFELLFESNHTH